ncbi:MAG: type II secretion system F family protein [Lentisphaeria bacterium]|nr:type II secretion system F family protein [Lentisphaeria bacterium]
MDFIYDNMYLLASVCAGLCALFATFVIVEFTSYTSARYKERFLAEAAVELDDVLLQLPANRILDLSIAVAAVSFILFGGLSSFLSDEVNWIRTVAIGTVSAVVAFLMPRFYLRTLKKQRLAKFNEQLEDALLSMSSALKAGFSITQALENVASENRYPISFEFTLLLQELRLGVQFDTALRKMADRLESQDFELVAVAIITARQTGGELTTVLEELAGVIRERMRIMQRVRALTSQGRMQAWLIASVPFVLMFAMMHIAPDLMDAFFGSMAGIVVLAAVLVMVVLGFLWIRKITTIDV